LAQLIKFTLFVPSFQILFFRRKTSRVYLAFTFPLPLQLVQALLNKSNFAELKDQITHLPDNADRSVAKQKFKITNWPTIKPSSTVAP
jgi:hypothetical protein